MRSLAAVLPAAAVLLAVTAALALVEDASLALVTERYAFVVFGVGAVLGAVFHRSRVVIASVALAYLEWVRQGASASIALQSYVTALLALLGAIALIRDRGVRSRVGAAQVAVAAGALALVHQILRDPVVVEELGAVRLLPAAVTERVGLLDVTIVVGAVAMLLTLLARVRWRGSVERALLWAQGLVLAAAHPSLAQG